MLGEVDWPKVDVVEGADGLARRAFSAGEVGRMVDAAIMQEDEPFELIDGELIFRNAQGFAHDRIKSALGRKLGRAWVHRDPSPDGFRDVKGFGEDRSFGRLRRTLRDLASGSPISAEGTGTPVPRRSGIEQRRRREAARGR